MVVRRLMNWFSLAVLLMVLAACSPPPGLPKGPTPIPTLIPVADDLISPVTEEGPTFTIQSYPARPPSALEGQLIFNTYCSECHGEDGTGTVPAARNFRDLDYVRAETPADFYAAITEGRGEMPAYQDRLSSDERWDAVFYVWRLSTSIDVLETGNELYDQNCSSCHGVDGSGELLGSADFTDLRQMDNLAPRDLYLSVTQGRGSMPAWQSLLSQDQRWAIIDYVRTFTYDPTIPEDVAAQPEQASQTEAAQQDACSTDQTNPFAWDDEDAIQAGEALYLLQCAMCHGPDGTGGLPNTPDFTSSAVSADIRSQPGENLCSIVEGKGVMPAFGNALSAQERGQVLTYLASLGQ